MKDCEWIKENMSLYLDDELNRQEKGEVIEHLENCKNCKTEYDILKTMVEELNNTEFLPLPEGYHNEVMEKINEQKVSKINFGQKRTVNWKKYSAIAAACVLTVVGVGAIGDMFQNGYVGISSAPQAGGNTERMSDSFNSFEIAETDISVTSADINSTVEVQHFNNADTMSGGDGDRREVVIFEEISSKKIKNTGIEIEIEDFDSTVKFVQDMVENSGGYIENYSSYIYFEDFERDIFLKAGGLTVRVDKDQYSAILEYIRSVGKVKYENEYVYDVTSQYIDVEARLNAKKTEEKKLIDLINDADTIADIIAIESRLSEVRGYIENFEMQIRGWDREVDYSSIYITLTEKNPKGMTSIDEDFCERIKDGFIKSVNSVISGFQYIAVSLAIMSVPILLMVVFGVMILFVARGVLKKNKNADKKQE